MKKPLLLSLLLVVAFVIAGCPAGDETTTTQAATTSTTATTTTTPTGAEQRVFVVELTGDQEVPPVQTAARGTFTIEFLDGTDTGVTGGTTTTVGTTGTDTTGADTTTTTGGTTTSAPAGTTTTDGGAGGTTTSAPAGGASVTTTTAGTAGGTVTGEIGIRWRLDVENINDVTAAHIHVGAEGENGPVMIPLFTGPPKEGEFSGTLAEGTLTEADLNNIEGRTAEEVAELIRTGRTYVNVHTAENPDGEIRGQIKPEEFLRDFEVVVDLSGEEEVPPVETEASGTLTLSAALAGEDANGVTTTTGAVTTTTGAATTDTGGTTTTDGAATTTTAGTTTTDMGGTAITGLRFRLEVEDIVDVAAAHIHLGARGENGPVLVPLFTGPPKEGEFSGVLAEGVLTEEDLDPAAMEGRTLRDLFELIRTGRTYVNVHTQENPDGEIRGQIELEQMGVTTTTVGGATTTTGGAFEATTTTAGS